MPKKRQPAGVGMTPTKTELGSFIRTRRLALDLRQVPLAKQAGLGRWEISLLETGKRKRLNDRQLERLAKALQCDPGELRRRLPVKRAAQPTTELGKLVRSRREELGLTLEDVAKNMGTTRDQAMEWEVGRTGGLSYKSAGALARVLELDPSALVPFTGRTRKQTTSTLGQLVRTRRKALWMSLSQLAQKLSVSRQYVNQIEFGKVPLSESDEMITRLARVLRINADELRAIRPRRRWKQVDSASPLGRFLAARRIELHLTLREVGERSRIFANDVSAIERGRRHPNLEQIDKLAKALDCHIPPELIAPPGP